MNIPQILQQLQGTGPMAGNMAQIKNMIGMIRGMGNPQAMVQAMAQNNPQVRQILQQYGGDPKQAFYGVAKQAGIDPDELLGMLKR